MIEQTQYQLQLYITAYYRIENSVFDSDEFVRTESD